MTEPKALTKKELRRLAKEARVLAMGCVEGTAPPLGWGPIWKHNLPHRPPNCSVGHLMHRAGFGPVDGIYSRLPLEERVLLVTSSERARDEDRHAAVVFPFLALADALEDASKTPKSHP